MKVDCKKINPAKHSTGCIVVGLFAKNKLSEAGSNLDSASKGYIKKLLKENELEGKQGESLLLHAVPGVSAKRVLIVGCGKQKDFDATAYAKVIKKVSSQVKASRALDATICLTQPEVTGRDASWKNQQAVISFGDTAYNFDQLKTKKNNKKPLGKLTLAGDSKLADKGCKQGLAIAHGISLAKDLCNLPANVCTPSYLAKQAQVLAKKYSKIKTTITNEAAMRKMGMGALLSVSNGSHEPAKLITMEYQGAAKSKKPLVFVGKGITFDSGGISIKPAAGMDEMKYDMGGAASVFGMLRAVAELKLPINIVGVVAASENLPGGSATKPGDIVKSMSGKTIEVLNTDAEGRLVLCDALTYVKKFNPEIVIDIATLTGAVVVALGHVPTGLMSNNEDLVAEIKAAGERSRDRVWQLPLWDDYQDQLKSNFADIANIGSRGAGSITAACFLSRFTKDYKWAHLDIAGTAWKSGAHKGATGRPVTLLTQIVLDRCK